MKAAWLSGTIRGSEHQLDVANTCAALLFHRLLRLPLVGQPRTRWARLPVAVAQHTLFLVPFSGLTPVWLPYQSACCLQPVHVPLRNTAFHVCRGSSNMLSKDTKKQTFQTSSAPFQPDSSCQNYLSNQACLKTTPAHLSSCGCLWVGSPVLCYSPHAGA